MNEKKANCPYILIHKSPLEQRETYFYIINYEIGPQNQIYVKISSKKAA